MILFQPIYLILIMVDSVICDSVNGVHCSLIDLILYITYGLSFTFNILFAEKVKYAFFNKKVMHHRYNVIKLQHMKVDKLLQKLTLLYYWVIQSNYTSVCLLYCFDFFINV